MVNVQVEITSDDLTALKACLDGLADAGSVAEIIARIGAREALDHATGKFVSTTMTDLRSSRVRALLLEGVEVEDVETIVAILFKVPLASAKRIVETAIARFDIDLNDSLERSAKKALEDAEWDDEGWKVTIHSTAVKKWLQNELATSGQPPIKQSGLTSVWTFPDGTYQHSRKHVGLPRRKHL